MKRLARRRRPDRLRHAGDRGGIDASAQEHAYRPGVAHPALDGMGEDLAEVFGVLGVAGIADAGAGIEIPISPHRRTIGRDRERVGRRQAIHPAPEGLGNGAGIARQILADHAVVDRGRTAGLGRELPHDLLHFRAKDQTARAGAIEQRALPHRIADADDAPRRLVAHDDDEIAEEMRAAVEAPPPPGREARRTDADGSAPSASASSARLSMRPSTTIVVREGAS